MLFPYLLKVSLLLAALTLAPHVVDGNGDVVLLNLDMALAGKVGTRLGTIVEVPLVVMGIAMRDYE